MKTAQISHVINLKKNYYKTKIIMNKDCTLRVTLDGNTIRVISDEETPLLAVFKSIEDSIDSEPYEKVEKEYFDMFVQTGIIKLSTYVVEGKEITITLTDNKK